MDRGVTGRGVKGGKVIKSNWTCSTVKCRECFIRIVTALLGCFDLDTKIQTIYLQFLQAAYNLKIQSAYINRQSSVTCDFLIKTL